MREKLLQLLPEIGVLGVPCVPQSATLQKSYAFDRGESGTPLPGAGVISVPASSMEHPEHLTQNRYSVQHISEIKAGTPRTPRTPDFVQDFIDDVEERAAIMEYDASDIYPCREGAMAAAFRDVMARRIENDIEHQ